MKMEKIIIISTFKVTTMDNVKKERKNRFYKTHAYLNKGFNGKGF